MIVRVATALAGRLRPAALLLAAAALFTASSNAAQSIDIVIQNAQYSTDLSTTVATFQPGSSTPLATTTTQANTSNAPLDNTLQASTKTFATAQANTFSVSTATSGLPSNNEVGARAKAIAQTVLTFNTLKDETAPLAFQVAGSSFSFFSQGFVSLYDLTFSQLVFSYDWASPSPRPGYPTPPPGSSPITWDSYYQASLGLEPQLLASHLYALTLNAGTDASTDSQYVSVQMSGFNPIAAPVPEPETYAMVLLGLGMVGFVARRRKTAQSG